MNNDIILVNDRLINKIKEFESKKSITEKLTFLNDFVVFVENDSNMIRHAFVTSNPFKIDSNRKDLLQKFNKLCLDFLICIASKGDNKRQSSEAQALIGIGYEIGLFGLQVNKKNAANYFIVSAKQGNKLGTYRLGQIYEKELGKSDNYGRALYFYRCSAKLGCIYGMHIYGIILLKGLLNQEKEVPAGLFYLKAASRKATDIYPFPIYDLAQAYESSAKIKEIEPDDEYALKLYRKAASMGCPNSQYKLGKCYETGHLSNIVNKQYAIDNFRSAADNGHSIAQYVISKYYSKGVSDLIERDDDKAFHYARMSAANCNPEGAYLLAEYAEKGIGIRKNILLSLWWYTISYKLGNKDAQSKMKSLRTDIDLEDCGSAKRRRWFCCC